MAEILKVLKGTKDILPQDMEMWHFLEEKANEVFSQYGCTLLKRVNVQ